MDALVIEKLSIEERLKIMEKLWNSIVYNQDKVPSPTWHKAVIAERVAKLEDGTATFISLDDLQKK